MNIFLTVLLSISAVYASQNETEKIAAILGRQCAPCHQAAEHPGALFLNKARLNEPATLRLLLDALKTNQMPPAHARFKETEDGKVLMKWLDEKTHKK